jgi:hypothetical protein
MISLNSFYNDDIKELFWIAKKNIYPRKNYINNEARNENIAKRPSIIVSYNLKNNNFSILISKWFWWKIKNI